MKATSVQQRLIKSLERMGKSDAELARQAGFSTPQFSQYKSGKRCAEDDSIVTLANMVGENPEEAVRQHRAEQAKTPEMRQFWLSFGKAAATITLAIILQPLTVEAKSGTAKSDSFYYVKLCRAAWLQQAQSSSRLRILSTNSSGLCCSVSKCSSGASGAS